MTRRDTFLEAANFVSTRRKNYVACSADVTKENWRGIAGDNFRTLNEPWEAMPIDRQSPENAYEAASHRDSIDTRIIEEVRAGNANFGNNGIITTPKDVGGWPELAPEPPAADADEDGIPDKWEKAHGLNPNDDTDGTKDRDGDGYTNVEEYINGLVTSGLSKNQPE